jgi:hypothetical protein
MQTVTIGKHSGPIVDLEVVRAAGRKYGTVHGVALCGAEQAMKTEYTGPVLDEHGNPKRGLDDYIEIGSRPAVDPGWFVIDVNTEGQTGATWAKLHYGPWTLTPPGSWTNSFVPRYMGHFVWLKYAPDLWVGICDPKMPMYTSGPRAYPPFRDAAVTPNDPKRTDTGRNATNR